MADKDESSLAQPSPHPTQNERPHSATVPCHAQPIRTPLSMWPSNSLLEALNARIVTTALYSHQFSHIPIKSTCRCLDNAATLCCSNLLHVNWLRQAHSIAAEMHKYLPDVKGVGVFDRVSSHELDNMLHGLAQSLLCDTHRTYEQVSLLGQVLLQAILTAIKAELSGQLALAFNVRNKLVMPHIEEIAARERESDRQQSEPTPASGVNGPAGSAASSEPQATEVDPSAGVQLSTESCHKYWPTYNAFWQAIEDDDPFVDRWFRKGKRDLLTSIRYPVPDGIPRVADAVHFFYLAKRDTLPECERVAWLNKERLRWHPDKVSCCLTLIGTKADRHRLTSGSGIAKAWRRSGSWRM